MNNIIKIIEHTQFHKMLYTIATVINKMIQTHFRKIIINIGVDATMHIIKLFN